MLYPKPYRSPEQQAQILVKKGLIVSDLQLLVTRLQSVGYYRLSAYWHPFRKPDDTLHPGTTFEKVWRRYAFDRRLRLLAMDAIERFEVALRVRVVERLTRDFGPFAHLNPASFAPSVSNPSKNNSAISNHEELLSHIRSTEQRAKEDFIRHFRKKYTSESDLPFWMAAELMSLGNLLTCYKHLPNPMRKDIAASFSLREPVLDSWILTLNYIRNLCAHHSRLWNREMGIKPIIPRDDERWKTPSVIYTNRVFAVLTLLCQLLQEVAPQSRWRSRLRQLLDEYPDVPRQSMGFIENWQLCPIWSEGTT